MKILWLSRADVRAAGGDDPHLAVPLVESALLTHASGDAAQPLKPYLRIPGDTESRRIIAMPAYLGGEFETWGLKWISSAPNNPVERGMERASAVIVLNDVTTARPVAIMEGAIISATRTAAVALIGAKYLARPEPRTLALLGCGLIGGMIAESLLTAHPSVLSVRLFDERPEAAGAMKQRLGAYAGDTEVLTSAEEVLEGADLIVTATTATDGYIEADWVEPGSTFINVSLRDPKLEVVEQSDKVVVDDWDQVNRGNTIIHRLTQAGRLSRDDIHGELAQIISGEVPGRESEEERIILNPMGLSIEDIATAWGVYQRARQRGLGVELEAY